MDSNEQIRVAAYCRVSTLFESQESSYELQVAEYTRMIQSHSNWILVGVYADAGGSGTSRKNRPQFNRMMRDAMAGKIDYILTKSLSRFSRNQLDISECVEMLKKHDPPVGVYFENDGIDSLDSSNDFIFSILSMVAQEQSHSISENIKLGIRNKFGLGTPPMSPDSLYGYKKGEHGEWEVDSEIAPIIDSVFKTFIGCGNYTKTAMLLNSMGYRTKRNLPWSDSSVAGVIANEKYVGDYRCQKTFTPDYKTHKAKQNRGEEQQYYIREHHTPIIDRKTWEAAQEVKSHITMGRKKTRATVTAKFHHSKEMKLFKGLKCRTAAGDIVDMCACRNTNKYGSKDKNNARGYFYIHSWSCKARVGCPEYASCSKKTIAEITIRQAFMEALYLLKTKMENGDMEFSDFIHERIKALETQYHTDAVYTELIDLENEKNNLIEGIVRFQKSREEHLILDLPVSVRMCEKVISEMQSELRKVEQEIQELEATYYKARDYMELADMFIHELLNLPETNSIGMKLKVNFRDVNGTVCRDAEGGVKVGKLSSIHIGGYKLTPERIESSPDLLEFDYSLFQKYFTGITYTGAELLFHTIFGFYLRGKGVRRRPNDYLGYRICENGILKIALCMEDYGLSGVDQ